MVYSMTGYGRASLELGHKTMMLEIRALNSRSLDLKVKLPQNYRDKELELRNLLSTEIERGKVDVSLDIVYAGGQRNLVNRVLFRDYYDTLTELGQEFGLETGDLIATICRFPGVLEASQQEADETEWHEVQNLIQLAMNAFGQYRLQEGKVTEDDLRERIRLILQWLEEVLPHETARMDKVRGRMQQHLEEVGKNLRVDENRLEQEVVFYMEKLDISEEKLRLKQNCDYFLEQLDAPGRSKGKILGFIVQEIGREINTLGSKANSGDIQRLVVQMKDELEKMKEQLANIL